MACTVSKEDLHTIGSYWTNNQLSLKWNCVFVLPPWMRSWWQVFNPHAELHLAVVREDADILGIAALQVTGTTASFIGSTDVCDYMDFVVVPGKEEDFFSALLNDLLQQGITELQLGHIRPDSTVITRLVPLLRRQGYQVNCQEEAVSVEINLPSTFDEYLASLPGKQRHEIKRKLRRLWEAGEVDYQCKPVSEGIEEYLDTFFQLFISSAQNKANFLTAQMESFFSSIAASMAQFGMLRVGTLRIDGAPVATTIGFDYQETTYLYNSGYDPNYSDLSVGLLSKVLGIEQSINQGKKKYDLLKGGETYKYRLGGYSVPLYHCCVWLR